MDGRQTGGTMDKLLLTVEEAEDLTAICRSKLYVYMASGALRSVKIGRSRRIARADLIAFIDQLRAQQGPYEVQAQPLAAISAA